jgi:syntaxin-binding protein 1
MFLFLHVWLPFLFYSSLVRGRSRGKGPATAVARHDSEYSSSRYVCKLKGILEAMAENNLSVEEYPSLLPLPYGTTGSAASVRTKSTRHKSRYGGSDQIKKNKAFLGPRQIVFMVGGMCYSELRSAEETMCQGEREFILGSTHFLKPAEYIKEFGAI